MNKEREIEKLRYEARLAYLDGRTKRAKELNKRADALEKENRHVDIRRELQEF